MKKISWLNDVFNRNKEISVSYPNLEIAKEIDSRIYLKEMAIETCSNYIARTISQTDFRYMKGKKRVKNRVDKVLNVRPNTDESATDFWQSVVNRLIRENEVLIIMHDNQLLIADSYYRDEKALYPDTFENVTIKNFTFDNKVFSMDDVIFLTYNNSSLNKFLDGLSKDYADLFATLIESYKSSYEIRSLLEFDTQQKFDTESIRKINETMLRLITPIKKGIYSVFSVFKGTTYSELPNTTKAPTFDEIDKIKNALTNDVAKVLGIPKTLINGDIADLESAMKSYITFCINPLLKKIKDELNAKIKMADDEEIKLFGVSTKSIIDNAESIDKILSSGGWTRNDIREEFGFERVDDPELDKYMITKNYQTIEESSKGGEE